MNSLSRYLSIRHLIVFGMTVPVLIMLFVGWLQWQSTRNFRASRDWDTHTHVVLFSLESFLSSMKDAEAGQRGYLLTHKESYLAPYWKSLDFAPKQLAYLRQITVGDPEQQRNLAHLEPLMHARFDELAQAVALEKSGDHASAIKVVMSDYGRNIMNEIRTTVGRMKDIQTNLLNQRDTDYRRDSTIDSELCVLLITLGLTFIVTILLLLRRLEQMQSMITICAWSKLIEYEGEWLSVEEYLSRRLHVRITHGISRIEAEKMLKLLEQEKSSRAA